MANILLMEQAKKLRLLGKGIAEISNKLKVSKSTVSYWCKDIKLKEDQVQRLIAKQRQAGIKALFKTFESRRAQRILLSENLRTLGRNDVGTIEKRDLFFIGLSLYWGEGYKKGNDEVGFTNSDSSIIRIIIMWFKIFYNVVDKDFILRVSINAVHTRRKNEIMRYWVSETSIPLNQFTKTSFINTRLKKVYKNSNVHFGTLRVKIRRGANIRRRIMGSLSAISDASLADSFSNANFR